MAVEHTSVSLALPEAFLLGGEALYEEETKIVDKHQTVNTKALNSCKRVV